MYLPASYTMAIVLMFITMLCWGSWANTQKLASNWRFELFYWDYTIGISLASLAFAFTLGSTGAEGLPFIADLKNTDSAHITSALLGGAIFNIGNILLVAAISIAGMAVAFPVGIGIALVLGTLMSYWVEPKGDSTILAVGVGLILVAIIIDAIVYKKAQPNAQSSNKGLIISIFSGLLIGVFYPLVSHSMQGDTGMGPYAAIVFFCIGVFVSNIPVNLFFMRKPLIGKPVPFSAYLSGTSRAHMAGILGGIIWCLGMTLNLVASEKAGPAVAYAFGQGATLIAAIWGVFVWKEFKGVKGVNGLLTLMFVCYVMGLYFIGSASS